MKPPSPESDFGQALAHYGRALGRAESSHHELLSKVRDLQAEIRRKNDLLAHRERLAVLGEISASVAHEIRNPLGGIRLYLDLLAREQALEENGTVRKIRRVVSRLDRVVCDVLSHSREISPRRQLVPVMTVVMDALDLAGEELGETGVALDVAVDDFSARLDADLIERLLLNLVLNASQALENDGTIYVRARRAGDDWVLTVEDDGPGIPPGRMDMLFTPFFSQREGGGGTGLGLSLCKRIAEAHGGEITAKNLPAGGASFRVSLPM